ncbi:hypothetical protein ACW9HQ_03510 [Nocardia gipuzkoensis]
MNAVMEIVFEEIDAEVIEKLAASVDEAMGVTLGVVEKLPTLSVEQKLPTLNVGQKLPTLSVEQKLPV